jgi:ferritin-like metal-binding protein YciE
MASVNSLEELFKEELKDIYNAEKQLTRALPKMAKKAGAAELKDAFNEHLAQTERHIERLEEVFEQLGMPARGKKCKGMENLIAEGEEMLEEVEDGDTRDAVLIAAAQKLEHYEIASYGTVRTWATLLGQPKVAAVLEQTLREEKETDQNLTAIAESFVNAEAADSDDDEEQKGSRSKGRGASVRLARSAAADRTAARTRAQR